MQKLALVCAGALLASGCSTGVRTTYLVDMDEVAEKSAAEQQPRGVTGSRIKRRTDPERRGLPVKVMTREDIEKSGAASAGEALGQSGPGGIF